MDTPSNTSPRSGSRGCLCKDGTYSSECCDGTLQAQGIGALEGQGDVILTQDIVERNIVSSNN